MLPLHLILVLIYSIFLALSAVVSRNSLKSRGNPLAFAVLRDVAAGVVVLPFVLIDFRVPTDAVSWLLVAAAAIFYGLSDYFSFRGVALEEISVLSVIGRLHLVLVFFGGVLFYNESLTPVKLLAIAIIFTGALLVTASGRKISLSKGALFALISRPFIVIGFLMDKRVSSNFSIPLYSFFTFAAPALMLFLLYQKRYHEKSPLSILRRVSLWSVVTSGFLFGIAQIARRYAFYLGEISKIAPLLNLSLVFTVFLGVVVLRERSRLRQKIAGLVVVIIGALFLGWG